MTEMSASKFGRVDCNLPAFPGVWVEFKTSGYPRKLRREWDAAGLDETLVIVLRYVDAWHMVGLDGADIPLPTGERKADLLDNTEDALVAWLTRSFARFWLVDLTAPRPNSSAPSPTTS